MSLDLLIEYLPLPLSQGIETLSQEKKDAIEEIRLRSAAPLRVCTARGDYIVSRTRELMLTQEDLLYTLERATNASLHTALPQLRNGFLPVAGGSRIGVCGSMVFEGNQPSVFRHLSSLNLRVAHELRGISAGVLPALLEGETLMSTLLISPPGMGKTTLLRDLIRAISEGEKAPPMQVGVVDERGELCGMHEGVPQLDIGRRTDVMDGCPKAEGLMMLLRGMGPELLAVDEITAPEDIQALESAGGCGVKLLATAHAGSMQDLRRRPLYQGMMNSGLFARYVVITRHCGRRIYQVFDGRGELCCDCSVPA